MVHTQAPHTLDEATLAALMQPEAGADPLAQAREAGASILNSGRNQPSSPTAEENEREAASHEALEACEMAEGAITAQLDALAAAEEASGQKDPHARAAIESCAAAVNSLKTLAAAGGVRTRDQAQAMVSAIQHAVAASGSMADAGRQSASAAGTKETIEYKQEVAMQVERLHEIAREQFQLSQGIYDKFAAHGFEVSAGGKAGVEAAEARLRKAKESGDPDEILKAEIELSDAQKDIIDEGKAAGIDMSEEEKEWKKQRAKIEKEVLARSQTLAEEKGWTEEQRLNYVQTTMSEANSYLEEERETQTLEEARVRAATKELQERHAYVQNDIGSKAPNKPTYTFTFETSSDHADDELTPSQNTSPNREKEWERQRQSIGNTIEERGATLENDGLLAQATPDNTSSFEGLQMGFSTAGLNLAPPPATTQTAQHEEPPLTETKAGLDLTPPSTPKIQTQEAPAKTV